METFKVGDILLGTSRARAEARHRVVYLSGSSENPVGVVLTHSNKFPCNIEMKPEHIESGTDKEPQYFVAHQIQKLSEWGPYERIGNLSSQGVGFVIANLSHDIVTWDEYLTRTTEGCPDHA